MTTTRRPSTTCCAERRANPAAEALARRLPRSAVRVSLPIRVLLSECYRVTRTADVAQAGQAQAKPELRARLSLVVSLQPHRQYTRRRAVTPCRGVTTPVVAGRGVSPPPHERRQSLTVGRACPYGPGDGDLEQSLRVRQARSGGILPTWPVVVPRVSMVGPMTLARAVPEASMYAYRPVRTSADAQPK